MVRDPTPVFRRRGEEGADVSDAEAGDIGKAGRLTQMAGEEGEKLVDVAGIGLDGLRRQPPLMGKVAPPPLDRLQNVGAGDDQRRCGRVRLRPRLYHGLIPTPIRLTGG